MQNRLIIILNLSKLLQFPWYQPDFFQQNHPVLNQKTLYNDVCHNLMNWKMNLNARPFVSIPDFKFWWNLRLQNCKQICLIFYSLQLKIFIQLPLNITRGCSINIAFHHYLVHTWRLFKFELVILNWIEVDY